MPEIAQVNISRGGVPKRAVPGARITKGGLEGDACPNLRYHGGPDQTILIASAEVIDELAGRGFPVFYGAIGENLTVRGLDVKTLRAGQTWLAGDALIELTKLREPCVSLDVYGAAIKRELYDGAARDGNPESPVWARGGFYAMVVREGGVAPGAPFELISSAV